MLELSPVVGVCHSQSPQIQRFQFYVIIYQMENISQGKGSCRNPQGPEGALERAAQWLQNEGN